jgi:hypothetical protein
MWLRQTNGGELSHHEKGGKVVFVFPYSHFSFTQLSIAFDTENAADHHATLVQYY